MRMWYKSIDFAIDKNITMFFVTPTLQKTKVLAFTEYGEGLYYLDYVFKQEGSYVGKISEDGRPVLAKVFRKNIYPGIITHNE